MFPRVIPSFLVLYFVALAGCSSPSGSTADEDAGPATPLEETPVPWIVHEKQGHLDAGVGASTEAATCWIEMGADRILEFSVPDGTAVLVLELAWDDSLQDLSMIARPPASPTAPCSPAEGDTGGFTGAPDGPARLVVQQPAPGAWTLGAQANGAVARTIQYTLLATVSAVALDDAYTAIPA